MKLWTVRAGRHGEQEQACLDNNIVAIGWDDIPAINKFKNRDELFEEYQKIYTEDNNVKSGIKVGQIWRFANEIKQGDVVALPSKFQPVIYIGKVTGDYQFCPDVEGLVHRRPVQWLKTIPRSEFDQDILYSFGSLLTVSQVSRDQAAERVLALAQGKRLPASKTDDIAIDAGEEQDIERLAKDQIIKLLDRKFKGHEFARLIDEILKAQGYTTFLSPPGPDGGLDILAGSGSLGLEEPRVCVQIKSTTAQVDVKTLRELQGVMRRVKAEVGLLVSWGGFNNKAIAEAKEDFFFIRLWTADDVLENIFRYYDKFSDELKTQLPLKRFWGVVEEGV